MKLLYCPVLLLALLGCQSVTHSGDSTVSATSASKVPSAARTPTSPTAVSATSNTVGAQSACEDENEIGYEISGPITAAQQARLATDNDALTHSGDPAITRVAAANMAPTAVGLTNILAECVADRYIPSAATVDVVAPTPVIPTAAPGSGLSFANVGGGIVIGPSPSATFTSLEGGLLRPANGHLVALVVYAQAYGQASLTAGDFYVRTPDGGHYDPTFAVEMTPAQLTFVTLNAGEKANGTLVFDLPVAAGFQLIYAPQSNILGVWQY